MVAIGPGLIAGNKGEKLGPEQDRRKKVHPRVPSPSNRTGLPFILRGVIRPLLKSPLFPPPAGIDRHEKPGHNEAAEEGLSSKAFPKETEQAI